MSSVLVESVKRDIARLRMLSNKPEAVSVIHWFSGLLSPRLVPVVLYRMSHACAVHRIPVVPKLLSLVNLVIFGIEISPQIVIGPGLFFPHTQGTVIGARSIGANAIIFQNVTLGASELDLAFRPEMRPEIGHDVVIGAGAKILGGVVIGDGARIGANAVVLCDVPPGCLAVGVPARILGASDSGMKRGDAY